MASFAESECTQECRIEGSCQGRLAALPSKCSYGQALVTAAQEAYDADIETYRQGLSTILELLTAQRDLVNARYTLIQSRADLLTSYAAVAYAAGALRIP
jgi:outer membrane protein TolC